MPLYNHIAHLSIPSLIPSTEHLEVIKQHTCIMIRNICNVFGPYGRIIVCQREKAIKGFRMSHIVSYREVPSKQSAITKVGAEIVGAAMWWWILWHLWHESEHITGEFPYPTTSAWTNSELGIPAVK